MDVKMRLVGRNGFGEYRVLGKSFDSEHTAIQRALERLYAYEELELSPGEIKVILEENERNRRVIKNLAEGKINNIETLQAECRRVSEGLC